MQNIHLHHHILNKYIDINYNDDDDDNGDDDNIFSLTIKAKSQQDALFLNFILVKNSTCFGQTCYPSSGVLILYSKQLIFDILVMLTASKIRIELFHPDLASRQM